MYLKLEADNVRVKLSRPCLLFFLSEKFIFLFDSSTRAWPVHLGSLLYMPSTRWDPFPLWLLHCTHWTLYKYCIVVSSLFFVQRCSRTQDAGGAECVQRPVAPSSQASGRPSSNRGWGHSGLLHRLLLTPSSYSLCSFTLWGEPFFSSFDRNCKWLSFMICLSHIAVTDIIAALTKKQF